MAMFSDILSDWTNQGYHPFAAPMETGQPWGVKNGDNGEAISRELVTVATVLNSHR